MSEKLIAAVRMLQPRRQGAKAKLARYHDDVLRAAIEAERSSPDARPMFISMLEAELTRRAGEPSQEKAMTDAAPAATAGYHQWIPLSKLKPSPLNHRKHFDKSKMDELTDSVRMQGVVVPVLARPLSESDSFEIVAGERRFRAAKAAGLIDLPAIVRELSDAQALELQVIENGQRVDVHPMEEAEGYEALMQCKRSDGSVYTVDDIAAKVGKSVSYVYGRLKLLDLCLEGRKAFWEGLIPASTALLIARVPVPKLQAKCVKEIVEPEYEDEPMSFRDAKEHLERNYMLRLKEAPFKTGDATLVAAAGSCKECPKRTGNQPELFADIAGADVCTDPACFDSKKKAWAARLREEAIAAGRTVISGKEAKKIVPYEYSEPKGYVRLDAACHDDPKHRTYRALLGKAAGEAVLIERPKSPGEFIEAVSEEKAAEIIKEKGYKFKVETSAKSEAERAKGALESDIEREARLRAYLALRNCVANEGFGPDDLRMILDELLDMGYGGEEIAEPLLRLWGATDEQIAEGVDRDELVKKAPNAQLVPMLLDAVVLDPSFQRSAWPDLAKKRGVDVKGIERDVRKEFKERAKAVKKGLASLGIETREEEAAQA